MSELVVWPNADLSGAWQQGTPLVVDGGSFSAPYSIGVDSAGYSGEDSAADALQPGVLTLPSGVVDDDVAMLVTAVTDETGTAAIGTAPRYGQAAKVWNMISLLFSGTFTLTFEGQTTGSIACDGTLSDVITALEALSNVDAGDLTAVPGTNENLQDYYQGIGFGGQWVGSDVTLTATPAYVEGRNEQQTVSTDHTSGTFTLTYDGQTTAGIAVDASGSAVEAALEALSNIDSVVCTGDLQGAGMVVDFRGTLAETDVVLMTADDTGASGGTGVTVSTTQTAVVEVDGIDLYVDTAADNGSAFTSQGAINVPRSGAAYEPQMELWTAVLTSADAGKLVSATVADHDTLHSWAVAMVVWRGVDTTTPVDATGSEETGTATAGGFGTITTVTDGARVINIGARAAATNQALNAATLPDGRTSLVSAASDSMVLDLLQGGYVSAQTITTDPASWGESLQYAAVSVAVRPSGALAAGGDMHDAIDDQGYDDWLELEPAAGAMFEVFELDLSGLPSGAVPVGVVVEFAHHSTVWNKIDVFLAGIDGSGNVALADPLNDGFYAEPIGQIDEDATGTFSRLADGSELTDYDRFGIVVRSRDRHPFLTTHRLYWARARIDYDPGGPVVDSVTGPTTSGAQVEWTYSSAGGRAQSGYEVMLLAGAGADPDTAVVASDPFNPSAGEIIATSGRVNESLARAADLPGPVTDSTHTVAVRAWARMSSGLEVVSDWATDDFAITGSAPGSGTHSTDPDFNEVTGLVDVEVDVPAGVSRAWLERSSDGGSTWEVTSDSPYAVTASATETLTDSGAGLGETLDYQVVFDGGANSEASGPAAVGSQVTLIIDGWYLVVPADPGLSTKIRVKGVSYSRPVRAVTVEQPGNSVTALSGPLARRARIETWVDNQADYLAILAALESGSLLDLLDIWGRRLTGRCVSGVDDAPQRWRSLPAESTGLRDAHVFSFELVEEVRG